MDRVFSLFVGLVLVLGETDALHLKRSYHDQVVARKNHHHQRTAEKITSCQYDQVHCADGVQCVFNRWVCDGDTDCSDGSDEEGCVTTCDVYEFMCSDERCIPDAWLCDGQDDCKDGTDESDCVRPVCEEKEFECSVGQCIPYSWVCDGETDCDGGTDEVNCTKTCGPDMFSCSNGQCLPHYWVCDGAIDCRDNSDESDCYRNLTTTYPGTTPNITFTCLSGNLIPLSYVCDGIADCNPPTDEWICPNNTFTPGYNSSYPYSPGYNSTTPSTPGQNFTTHSMGWNITTQAPGRECKDTKLGTEYRGHASTTISGRTCQRWDLQYPHRHSRNNVHEYPDAVYNEANYCRNPDHEGEGPWCYTTDPDKRWEYCDVPFCDGANCKRTTLGVDYRGQLSTTVSGRTCQSWSSQYPHEHIRNDISQFPDAAYNEANYCRNPDHEGQGPWCYTTDPDKRWEYCDISFCDDIQRNEVDLAYVASVASECTQTILGTDYRGSKSTTVSGLTCQRWDRQYPHSHTKNDVNDYPDAAHNEENYCRNPDRSEGIGPWCYTTNPDIRWETCGVPICPDCKTSELGVRYSGQRSVTATGRTCQSWNSQYPHEHSRNNVNEFPDAVYNEANYCRNPDHEPQGPWCYTTDPDKRWEYCNIPFCAGCRTTASGGDYRGNKSVTISGRLCQRWDTQYPHQHSANNRTRFPNARFNEANYCRDPVDSGYFGPWCYTTDPFVRWEACGVPLCPNSLN